jgi:hypothetical protein
MDYADAALVTLADVLRIERVFTTDRRGFAVYRRSSGGLFCPTPTSVLAVVGFIREFRGAPAWEVRRIFVAPNE